MIKIAFLTDTTKVGGKERQLVEMIRYAKQQLGFECHVFCLYDNPGFGHVLAEISDSFTKINRPTKKSLSPFLQLYRHFRHREIDIAHSFDPLTFFYAFPAAKMLRIPIINGSIRDAGVEKGAHYYFKKASLLLATKVISNSQAGLDYYGIHNGEIVYNFIDTSRFTRSDRRELRIVMNASFSDYKDQMTFILAIRRLLEEQRVNSAVLIGDGKYREKFEKLVADWACRDQIVFTGLCNNVEEVLKSCSIGVLCSTKQYREGVSNSLLEYMGSGIVAIGSDIGATNEVIQDGFNGLLFEVENPQDLYAKLNLIIDNPSLADSMISNAYLTLQDKFGFTKNFQKLTNIYRQLISRP